MKRIAILLTLSFIACCAVSAPVRAAAQLPLAAPPAGWSAHRSGGLQYFLPPGDSSSDVYEAIFPTQSIHGSLQQTAGEIWQAIVGPERIVDTKTTEIRVSDGVPACEVLVASIDARNQSVYRVFVVKQYGDRVAAGELHFGSVERIKAIGQPALASLENMSAAAQSAAAKP